MADNSRPHIVIPKNRLKTSKKPVRGGGERIIYSHEERASFSKRLNDGLDIAIKGISNQEDVVGLSSYIFKISTRQDLNLKNMKKQIEQHGIHWLYPLDRTTIVVALDKNELESYKRKIGDYGEREKLNTYFDSLLDIVPIKEEEKITRQILSSEKNLEMAVDVNFYSGLALEDYEKSIDYVKKEVGEKKVLFRKMDIPEIRFLRVKTTPDKIKKIASSVPSIRKIEQIPQTYLTSVKQKDSPDVVFEAAADDLKTIMVIDCGINHEHPGIKNVLITRKSYLSGVDTADIDGGHGTFVAGLAAYGFIPNTNPKMITPSAKIGAAKIHQDGDTTPIESLIGNIVKDGLERGIRLYSLTVLVEGRLNEISNLAYVLDDLSHKHDVLFIVSTGNIPSDTIKMFYRIGKQYPNYFTNHESHIYAGAEACCTLSVGGVAHATNSKAIARIREASPFTRSGPTIDGRLKPEIVHFAGNMTNDFEFSEDLDLTSLCYQPDKGVYATKSGTSCSAPIIANMASQILRHYPNASANLIRALLIHNSEIPNEARIISDMKNLYGFGFPNLHRCLYSTSVAPTLIFEGEVSPGDNADISIPIPEELQYSKGSKYIKITLAYDPPVSIQNQNVAYSLLDLSFQLLWSNEHGEYIRAGSERNWLTPHYHKIDNNPVKRDVFMWERGHWGEEWKLRITPNPKMDLGANKKQRFAIVMTIEDSIKAFDFYSVIQRKFEMEQAKISLQVAQPQTIRKK